MLKLFLSNDTFFSLFCHLILAAPQTLMNEPLHTAPLWGGLLAFSFNRTRPASLLQVFIQYGTVPPPGYSERRDGVDGMGCVQPTPSFEVISTRTTQRRRNG
ncbi:hypothetical protein BKA70DRAFT_1291389, partial [Coprinopsis sp. MPI-PUGE-AT-0042]